MRADRLLSILMLLQTRGRMTAHDLAEHDASATHFRTLVCYARNIILYTRISDHVTMSKQALFA